MAAVVDTVAEAVAALNGRTTAGRSSKRVLKGGTDLSVKLYLRVGYEDIIIWKTLRLQTPAPPAH